MTLNNLCKILGNWKIIIVYEEYNEEWEEGEFKDEFGDIEGYVDNIFSIRGEKLPYIYLQEKYANAEILKMSLYDGGVVRAYIYAGD